jgi:hypothetical protein
MIDIIELRKLRKQFKQLGIDKATVEKAAESLMEIPELRQVFENQTFKEGFEGRVDKLYEEAKDIFDNHKEHPDVSEKE